MVGIVDTQDSLRISILIALGLQGCAGAPQTSSPSGESTSVVIIAPVSSASVAVEPSDSTDSEIPVISSKIGWVTESNGNAHRATVTTCDPTNNMPACAGTEGHLSCKTDADCTEQPHGKCTTGYGQVGSYCGCTYSCASDSDCGANEACVCKGIGRVGQGHSVCAKAFCSTDKDCKSKQCGLSIYHNGCSAVAALVCRTKEDTCISDSDCPARSGQCVVARPASDAKWQCATRSCVIGRPLVIEGETRAAPSLSRADWQANLAFDAFDIDSLDRDVRNAVTNHYLEMAAMEHASVASFARFSLQLMALGAPAELLQDALCAARDEIEHARTSYALAAIFGKTNVGPDKLPAAIAPIDVSVDAFVKALVLEGCVGETLGAAEGRAVARNVMVPEMTQTWSTIADDEERHATLAWRTLKWALETFGENARDAAARGFVEAITQYSADPVVPVAAESFGILSAKELGTLRRQVLSVVVAPCARALGISMHFADVV